MKNNKRVWSTVLKVPLQLLVVASWLASFYAAGVGLQGINWGTPVVFTILLALYLTGAAMGKKK